MAVSKKLRFEVFRRDNWQCRYCGRAAKDGIVLEPDHVVPRARGGKDVATNLVTACEDCNSGKSDTPISAPPIEDVPQELFRRACADRGIDGDFLEDAEGLATEILSGFRMSTIDSALAEAREWLAELDEQDPTMARLHAQAAIYASDEQHRRVRALTGTLERFLEVHQAAEVGPLYEDARGRLKAKGQSDPDTSLVVMEAARQQLQQEDQRLLDGLSTEESTEWLAYADALFGNEPPWSLGDEDRVRYAAHVVRLARVGRAYVAMCGGPGEHIPHCPRRATYRFRAKSSCAECEHHNLANPEGHLACGFHIQVIREGEMRCPQTEASAELLDVHPLESGEKEPA